MKALGKAAQQLLPGLGEISSESRNGNTTTFVDNMKLPVHRWFRFSAGFAGAWAESLIKKKMLEGQQRVFDPFCGSGTTLIAAENAGVESFGIDPHPFVSRITKAKLHRRSNADQYLEFALSILRSAKRRKAKSEGFAPLIQKCYTPEALEQLEALRSALDGSFDDSPAAQLSWLTLLSILRVTSHVGTASWQYILPNKSKAKTISPYDAFSGAVQCFYEDMLLSQAIKGPKAKFKTSDARDCKGVPTDFATLVITSPPYPNNYDYADATRLEMTFMGEIESWGDLQGKVRKHLLRSCSQHVTSQNTDLDEVLSEPLLEPIRKEIERVCSELGKVRLTKGGKKNYHLMVGCYFRDLALCWQSLRRVCSKDSEVCFVIGDSAPYGVYVPVHEWFARIAEGVGFQFDRFEEIRKRNIKWKNRKHRVPLCEGELWLRG